MKNLFIVIIFLCSTSTMALEFEEYEVYRTKVELSSIFDKDGNEYVVGANSKFEVLDTHDQTKYVIRFKKIYSDKRNNINFAKKNIKYTLDRTIEVTPIEKLVIRSFAGLVSGPLIIPFKYRINDKSLGGETTIGYYAGYAVDFFNTGMAITPFASAGFTQINISTQNNEEDEIDNESGFTWAVGLLFQNWDKINIGIVYGQDRIGSSDWKHEGKGWVSFSVGWKI